MSKPVIGLTGPTGAGKSTVAAALKKLGCAVVDADRIARETVGEKECLEALRRAFGGDIAGPDGKLDRRLLAQRAFSSPENTRRLNSITHPLILKESVRRIEKEKRNGIRAVILDAPLLFESGADSLCDTTIAVVTSEESRLKRIMARDQITREQALERMKAQHDGAYYTSRAAYPFDGSIGWGEFDGAVAALLERILRETDGKR